MLRCKLAWQPIPESLIVVRMTNVAISGGGTDGRVGFGASFNTINITCHCTMILICDPQLGYLSSSEALLVYSNSIPARLLEWETLDHKSVAMPPPVTTQLLMEAG